MFLRYGDFYSALGPLFCACFFLLLPLLGEGFHLCRTRAGARVGLTEDQFPLDYIPLSSRISPGHASQGITIAIIHRFKKIR